MLEIIELIKAFKKLKNESAVGDCLGLSRQALHNHKTRVTLPFENLIDFCEREDVSFDWLVLGRDASASSDDLNEIKKRLSTIEKKLK